jgi:hypothetical protein
MSSVFHDCEGGRLCTRIALCLAAAEGREGRPVARQQNQAPTVRYELPDDNGATP